MTPAAIVINNLITGIGSVSSVETHLNMLVMFKNHFPATAPLDMVDYLAANLGHRINADEALTLVNAVMALDAGIVSIKL